MRLDIYVAQTLDVSRSAAAKLIDNGCVLVDNLLPKKAGIEITEQNIIDIKGQPKQEKIKNNLTPNIVYEDNEILILDKPSGLIVHDGAGVKDSTLVDWLKENSFCLADICGEDREGIVHRLDKETSGLIAIAKTNNAAESLKTQLNSREMGRYYIALSTPVLKDNRIIDEPLSRNPHNRLKRSVDKNGKEAKTFFSPITSNDKFSLIAAKLATGRTHQIRAHLAHFSRHILGDELYGFKSIYIKIPRVMLHAGAMHLIHPNTNQQMQFFANVPDDFQSVYEELFNEKTTIDVSNLPSYFDWVLKQ